MKLLLYKRKDWIAKYFLAGCFILLCNLIVKGQLKTNTKITSDQAQQLKIYSEKINEYRYTAFLDSTKFYFKKALPIALKQNDSSAIFKLYKQLGDAYEHHQFKDSTLLLYDTCEKYIPAENYRLKSFLLVDRAYTYQLMHDYEKNTELNIEALKMAQKSGDKKQIGHVTISLAESFSSLNLTKQADEYFQKSIEILLAENDESFMHQAYRYYAIHLLKNKEFATAYSLLQKANLIAASLNDSISMAYNWHYLADYFWHTKQVDSCFLVAKKAEQIWEQRVEYLDLSDVCLQQGSFYTQLNNYSQALFYLKKAEKYIVDNLYFNEKLYSAFADLYIKMGKEKEAYTYLQKAKIALEKIKENESKSKVAGLTIKFESLKKENENKVLANENNNLQTQKWIALALCVLLILLGLLLLNQYKKKQKTNNQLAKEKQIVEQQANEKLILINEIHHRVKNNLTMLKSLLYLQARASTQQETKNILAEVQARVQSMALVHQNLYEGNQTATLNFPSFIEDLFAELSQSYFDKTKQIDFTVEGSCKALIIEKAIPLALIMNELVTNSFKYAFVNKVSGSIKSTINQIENTLHITYSDDGNGLPQPFDLSSGGFGFKVLNILTQQLNATINYHKTAEKSIFKISLPV